ncbi:Carboxylesterase [Mycena sp. CBHHK59/15]|nr:Carboxylesterase [Mycena sp. CBHHK59/15]
MKSLLLILFYAAARVGCTTDTVVISTTSGQLHGTLDDCVMSFKGVRFAHAPTGPLRWEPPVPFVSAQAQNATALGPSCLPQFSFVGNEFSRFLYNNPPPPSESEDCLFLNVWAPAQNTTEKKPVVFWIHGGGLSFGSASLPVYDGTSLASNQGIVVVTINYRTNIFGFPSSEDIPMTQNNLGFLDQELALEWVQLNIAQFGGDPDKVTLMGQSAGSWSVGQVIVRDRVNLPFRAAVMLSGAMVASVPVPDFSSFNNFAAKFGCSQAPGLARLQCLKQVPASLIQNFTNGPLSGSFGAVVDNVMQFTNPLERLRSKPTVPLIIGDTEDDGSVVALGVTDIQTFLNLWFYESSISPDFVRSLYPGLKDSQVISNSLRDLIFRCPAQLYSEAVVASGTSSVFRYTYGPVFADLQKYPGAGAWHTSELGPLFGTFNRSTATPAEATWSSTFQTAIANFIKDPNAPPAVNWPEYIPGPTTKTLAKLAYDGNVDPHNFVENVQSDSVDGPCDALWNNLGFAF